MTWLNSRRLSTFPAPPPPRLFDHAHKDQVEQDLASVPRHAYIIEFAFGDDSGADGASAGAVVASDDLLGGPAFLCAQVSPSISVVGESWRRLATEGLAKPEALIYGKGLEHTEMI